MADITAVDAIVQEYLLYRGFTHTFKTFTVEKSLDRTRLFDADRVVALMFEYIHTFDILHLADLWKFLTARFFIHLDSEHSSVVQQIRTAILRLYVVHAVKKQNKQKVHEFFADYCDELNAHDNASFRDWCALPFLAEPEKDPEFRPYFTQQWQESVRITLHNFLSVVFRSAPQPKLLQLERWFRSTEQQQIQRELREYLDTISEMNEQLCRTEQRLIVLRSSLKDLAQYVHQSTNVVDISGRGRPGVGLFEADDEVEQARQRVKDLGHGVCKLALETVHRGVSARAKDDDSTSPSSDNSSTAAVVAAVTRERIDGKIPSRSIRRIDNDRELEEAELQLVKKIDQWLTSLRSFRMGR